MAVASTSGTQSTGSQGTGSGAATNKLFSTYDTFLKLLTTQLKVQNPLEPTDADKFTEQLVQYSAVEQQIKTNSNLEAMLASLVSNAALGLVNYLDKTVTVQGDTSILKDGKAKWALTSSGATDEATVTVRNAAGAVVYTGKMALKEGQNTYEWDGRTSAGGTAPEGSYSLSVSGQSESGSALTISSRVTGTVTGVDTSGSEPSLRVNGSLVPLSKLLAIGS